MGRIPNVFRIARVAWNGAIRVITIVCRAKNTGIAFNLGEGYGENG